MAMVRPPFLSLPRVFFGASTTFFWALLRRIQYFVNLHSEYSTQSPENNWRKMFHRTKAARKFLNMSEYAHAEKNL